MELKIRFVFFFEVFFYPKEQQKIGNEMGFVLKNT